VSDPALEAASAALDDGRPEDALAALEGQEGADVELLAGWAHLDLGQVAHAEARVTRAAGSLPDQDLDLRWLRAELDLRAWRIEAARAGFEGLLEAAREPAFLERLSLCLDLAQDWPGADALLTEAVRLDPEGSPAPARLTDAAFDAVVGAAITDLSPPFQEALARCRLVTEPVPFPELAPADDPGAVPPDLFGLFTGPDLHEMAEDHGALLPPTIYLFQRNLERACAGGEALREEIRVTLFHELGHLLGLDEDQVDAMGLG
jgi:predicted Zn-dependent protease with MMP-like domain